MAKKQPETEASKNGEICAMCAGTGKIVQLRSARRGRPDLGSPNCPDCGGTGRIKKPKPT